MNRKHKHWTSRRGKRKAARWKRFTYPRLLKKYLSEAAAAYSAYYWTLPTVYTMGTTGSIFLCNPNTPGKLTSTDYRNLIP